MNTNTNLHLFDLNSGVYLGSRPAQTRPNGEAITDCLGATPVAPPAARSGYIPCWNGSAWELKEDHRGKTGWLNGRPHIITDYGPYPEGWSSEPPEPDEAELQAQRIAEIKARLQEIDLASIRPLRAKAAGTATAEDEARYTELETEAAALRLELVEPAGLAGLEEPES